MRQDGPREVPSHRPLRHLSDLQSLCHTGFAGKESWVVFRVSQSASGVNEHLGKNQKPILAEPRGCGRCDCREQPCFRDESSSAGFSATRDGRRLCCAEVKNNPRADSPPSRCSEHSSHSQALPRVDRSKPEAARWKRVRDVCTRRPRWMHQGCVCSTLKSVFQTNNNTARVSLQCVQAQQWLLASCIPASIIPAFAFPSTVGRLQS